MIRSTWALPGVIAAATLAGLVLALTGDGWRDGAGVAGIALPIAATGWAAARARH